MQNMIIAFICFLENSFGIERQMSLLGLNFGHTVLLNILVLAMLCCKKRFESEKQENRKKDSTI